MRGLRFRGAVGGYVSRKMWWGKILVRRTIALASGFIGVTLRILILALWLFGAVVATVTLVFLSVPASVAGWFAAAMTVMLCAAAAVAWLERE